MKMKVFVECIIVVAAAVLFLPTSSAEDTILDPSAGDEVNKIILGEDVDTNNVRYPYQALLYTDEGHWTCGGTLIAPTWVLSAAHCAIGQTLSKVQIARVDLEVPGGYEELDIINQIIHPDYDDIFLWYDFLLLELSAPSTAQVIQLDDGSQPLSGIPLRGGTELTAVGFGADFHFLIFTRFPTTLQEGQFVYWENWACNLLSFPFINSFQEDTLCAGGLGGVCMGDSGGPLMVKGENAKEDVQVGVTSFGPRTCGRPGAPDGFGRVSVVYDWIQSHIAESE